VRRKYTKTYHIIFDAFGVNKKILGSERTVLRMLMEIPKMIDMKIMSGPNLVKDYDKRKPGLTGFAIIEFSHISIHTFINTNECFIDIFSCKEFHYDKIRAYLYRILKVKKSQVETIDVRYPWRKQGHE
jgi:S-adenosylmethionine decarboxylase